MDFDWFRRRVIPESRRVQLRDHRPRFSSKAPEQPGRSFYGLSLSQPVNRLFRCSTGSTTITEVATAAQAASVRSNVRDTRRPRTATNRPTAPQIRSAHPKRQRS
jgi:hypothetical protein